MTLVVGLMSGTSLDGVDAALVDVSADSIDLVDYRLTPFEESFRERLRTVVESGTTRDVALIHAALGDRLADAACRIMADNSVRPHELRCIGSHGQTLWHEPPEVTLQLGDAARIAERTGVAVVADFRSSDLAAGGRGAPLVSLADCLLFGADWPRVLLNVGGIANFTAVVRAGAIEGSVATDTGPGCVLTDHLYRTHGGHGEFDADGKLALTGRVDEGAVSEFLSHPHFSLPLPRTTGRELFDSDMADHIVGLMAAAAPTLPDILATSVAITARSIADCVRGVVREPGELVGAGGGFRNLALRSMLERELPGWKIVHFEDLYFNADAKEAAVFGWLAWRRLEGLPGNAPVLTGAAGGRALGAVYSPLV